MVKTINSWKKKKLLLSRLEDPILLLLTLFLIRERYPLRK